MVSAGLTLAAINTVTRLIPIWRLVQLTSGHEVAGVLVIESIDVAGEFHERHLA